MYSMEGRRVRYLIIYGCQQFEDIRENVLKLHTSERAYNRTIQLEDIKNYRKDNRCSRFFLTIHHLFIFRFLVLKIINFFEVN